MTKKKFRAVVTTGAVSASLTIEPADDKIELCPTCGERPPLVRPREPMDEHERGLRCPKCYRGLGDDGGSFCDDDD
jgi:hypothetical protein